MVGVRGRGRVKWCGAGWGAVRCGGFGFRVG